MRVNNKDYSFKYELTVYGLLGELKQDQCFSFLDHGDLTVILNGRLVREEEYQNLFLREEDEVTVFSAMFGG